MSITPYFYIEIYNAKEDKWEDVTVYVKDKDKFVSVPVWLWNGTHELFSILGAEHNFENYDFDKIHYGLPKNATNTVKESYEKYDDNYKPDVYWINLADALLYLHDHAKVKDIEAMEEYWESMNIEWKNVPEQLKDNPLKHLIDRVYAYLNIWNDSWYCNKSESDIRIIYWLS